MFYNDFEKSNLKGHVNELPIASILADEKSVDRIVINIIQNALRYAKTYFTIELAEEEIFIRLSAVNDADECNHAEIQHIFDRSFRVGTDRTSGQLGLGIHIVQQLVHKQGGEVTVEMYKDEFEVDVLFKKWE